MVVGLKTIACHEAKINTSFNGCDRHEEHGT